MGWLDIYHLMEMPLIPSVIIAGSLWAVIFMQLQTDLELRTLQFILD